VCKCVLVNSYKYITVFPLARRVGLVAAILHALLVRVGGGVGEAHVDVLELGAVVDATFDVHAVAVQSFPDGARNAVTVSVFLGGAAEDELAGANRVGRRCGRAGVGDLLCLAV